MIELVETVYKKDGTKDENKKLFSSLSKLLRIMRKQGYIPSTCLYELNRKKQVTIKMNGEKHELKIVKVDE